VTGKRFWLLLAALWVTLTGTLFVWLTLINAPGASYAIGGVSLDRNLASPYLLLIAVTVSIAALIVMVARRRSLLQQMPPPTSGT
jgi:hypothetical protein